MRSPTIEKKLTLPFAASAVKESINKILDADKSKYFGQERDDLLGTYTFSNSVPIMQIGRISISVSETSPDKTELLLSVVVMSGTLREGNLLSMVDHFLKLISLSLKGDEITAKTISANTGGCAVVILLLITLGSLFIYIIRYGT